MHELPQLVLLAAILGLAMHIVWFVHRATRQLRGEIRVAAIVRDTLAEEFPNQRPPTNPPAVQGRRTHLQLVKTSRASLLFELARRAVSLRQAFSAALIAAVAVTAVVLLADPIGRHAPGSVPGPGAAFADTPTGDPTPPVKVEPAPAAWQPTKEPAEKTPTPTPTPRREMSSTPEPTRVPTKEPKRTKAPEPSRSPAPRPRKTVLPEPPELPVPVPTTVCVPALDVQVCVTR